MKNYILPFLITSFLSIPARAMDSNVLETTWTFKTKNLDSGFEDVYKAGVDLVIPLRFNHCIKNAVRAVDGKDLGSFVCTSHDTTILVSASCSTDKEDSDSSAVVLVSHSTRMQFLVSCETAIVDDLGLNPYTR